MADLTYRDWGRIYAYVRIKELTSETTYNQYKTEIESTPRTGVTHIINDLNNQFPTNKILFDPAVDAICAVIDPPLTLTEIEKYRSGERPAKLKLRLAC